MAKKVTFSEKQWDYIMEKCGVSPEKMKEIDEATTCSSVGASTTRGDIGYDAPIGVKKNDPSLVHQKPGGICCGHVGDEK